MEKLTFSLVPSIIQNCDKYNIWMCNRKDEEIIIHSNLLFKYDFSSSHNKLNTFIYDIKFHNYYGNYHKYTYRIQPVTERF